MKGFQARKCQGGTVIEKESQMEQKTATPKTVPMYNCQ